MLHGIQGSSVPLCNVFFIFCFIFLALLCGLRSPLNCPVEMVLTRSLSCSQSQKETSVFYLETPCLLLFILKTPLIRLKVFPYIPSILRVFITSGC